MDIYLTITAAFAFIAFCVGYSFGYIHGLFRSYNIFEPKQEQGEE